MAEGRVCFFPGSCRTNCIVLERPASKTCRHHFNSSIGGGISYESTRNENLSGRLPRDRRAASDTGDVNPENRRTKDANRQQFNGGKGIDEQNSDCG
jgi:hypothetical protein